MKHAEHLNDLLGNIDIYLLDQIMKGRYPSSKTILDAGCGRGRNLHWFISKGYEISGIDQNAAAIEDLQLEYASKAQDFTNGDLERMPYPNSSFDHLLCNAVLHFARDHDHFNTMFTELVRVIKPNGSIFIRMTSNIGLKLNEASSNGVYNLPDGSNRYLITEKQINQLLTNHNLGQIEPVKSVVVEGIRSMTTLVLEKR